VTSPPLNKPCITGSHALIFSGGVNDLDDDWEIVREPSDDIVEECGSAVTGNPAFDKRHLAAGEQNFL
jgi:hypothetical protein